MIAFLHQANDAASILMPVFSLFGGLAIGKFLARRMAAVLVGWQRVYEWDLEEAQERLARLQAKQ